MLPGVQGLTLAFRDVHRDLLTSRDLQFSSSAVLNQLLHTVSGTQLLLWKLSPPPIGCYRKWDRLQRGKKKILLQETEMRGFPGGRVVRNLPVKAGEVGSTPDQWSHMPWGQLNPHTTTREPECCNYRAQPLCSPWAKTRDKPTLQGRSRAPQLRPDVVKNQETNTFSKATEVVL